MKECAIPSGVTISLDMAKARGSAVYGEFRWEELETVESAGGM